ncbi:GDP-mannose 4,6-dehydratase [Lichenicola sp.]|uniref:GDP-mannose 4,6-dehydratase n=1 Tax=Lichenicola sp. TaxID=2804529 RepID=UPI003B00EA63
MSDRRILVTGLSGFVGQHLARAMQDVLPDSELLPLTCDVTDADAVQEAVATLSPDACLHLAAISAIPVARAAPDRAWAVNLQGTLNLARALHAERPDAWFLHVSSGDAYGASFKLERPLDEDAPLAPINTYGATKAAADMAMSAMAAEGFRVIRLRPFNHTGPGQAPDFAIPAFARQIALIRAGRQEPILRTGSLTAFRDFLDVRDVCRAYALCLRHANGLAPGTILNIASGTARRIGDVLQGLLALSGVAVSIETDPSRARPTDIPLAIGNAGRLRDRVGWDPEITWEQTLRDVLDDWTLRIAELD